MVSEDRRLTRRVSSLAALVVGVIALGGWLVSGPDQALGALLGGVIAIGNFLWLERTARLALERVVAGSTIQLRAAVWLGTSGVRLAVVGVALGVAALQGWLGLAGLVVALTALPVAVVAEGLRVARLS